MVFTSIIGLGNIFREAGESAQIMEWEERVRTQVEAEREQFRQEIERLRREIAKLRAASIA
jgi:alkylhydroperoxidase family enzyme